MTSTNTNLIYQNVMTLAAVVMLTATSFAQSNSGEQTTDAIGLDGYCPVCIIAAGKWEAGSNEITSTYDGVTYLFPNQSLKQTFDQSPAKFVPALAGDCVVCLPNAGKRVAGNVNHATMHNGRLFLFPDDETKAEFESNPAKYENVDLAADGNCVVCNGHDVKGSAEFTEIHDGMRYQFPSAEAAAFFRRAPEKYAVGTQVIAAEPVSETLTSSQVVASDAVTVTGTSTCAVCEFGVKPLGNPEELGMAVKTSDGHVIVVEKAHVLYPQIYKARYAGQNVQVEGKILKSEGRVSWLNPSSIRVLN